MTQTIIKVPATGGSAFDPTDIVITDNTSSAFLIKDDSGSPTEYMRIDTTSGAELTKFMVHDDGSSQSKFVVSTDRSNSELISVTPRNVGLGNTEGVFFGGNSTTQVWVSGPSTFRLQGAAFVHNTQSGRNFAINSDAVSFLVTHDSDATFTLDDGDGGIFKIVDNATSPRTYFTATENGIVEVDGVKITANIGGSTTASIGIGNLAFNTTQTGFGSSVAIGDEAGKSQSSGHSTVLIGRRAGVNLTTPSGVVSIGTASMETNTVTGNNNTTCGAFSMRAVSSGANNTALGKSAGDSITTGSGNIAIGHDSDCAAGGTNQIAIGNGVVESTNNRASIGDSSNVATLDFSSSGNSWSNTSDVRIKENIQDSDLGLAFINSLRPVKHTSKDPAQWPEEIRPAEPTDRTPEQLEAVKDGLIAQEVKAAADSLGTTFSGWEQEPNGLNRLQYERFVVPLIKAVQELSAQVEELKGDK